MNIIIFLGICAILASLIFLLGSVLFDIKHNYRRLTLEPIEPTTYLKKSILEPSVTTSTDNDIYDFPHNDKEAIHSQWSVELIKSLEWKKFEELCAEYFKIVGYEAHVTKQGADGGIDIKLTINEKHGVAQCKAWNTYKVGVKPVRELFGVMVSIEASYSFFLTSSTYTKEAKKFSEGKNIKLISGDILLSRILSLPSETQTYLLKKITKGDYKTPTCPSCDIKMIKRTNHKNTNKFWGCCNFPKCYNTLSIKKST